MEIQELRDKTLKQVADKMIDQDIIDFVEVDEDEDDNIFEEPENDGGYSEVLQLTELTNGTASQLPALAEYNKVGVLELTKDVKSKATNFVSKVTKFVTDFDDAQLTEQHKKYIKVVGKLELEHLENLLFIIEMNKAMINNVVERVNFSLGEDYTAIMTYNKLISDHIKIIKETQAVYRSLPATMKKMRSEVLTNVELKDGNYIGPKNEQIGENYGELQFNSGKQMLQSLLKTKEKEKELKQNLSIEELKTNEIRTQLSAEDLALAAIEAAKTLK
jgi:hypothetical protein